MGVLLLNIIAILGHSAKQAWTFVRAKALLLWVFITVVVPKFFAVWKAFRLIRYGAIAAVFYMLYRVVHDSINAIVVGVDLATGIGSLIQDTGWASWLIWDGPLQMSVLWDQLVSCFAFKISLNTVALAYTKIRWYMGPLFTGGMGPRS